MPQFVLLLHDTGFEPGLSPAEMEAIVQRYVAWRAKVQANGRAVSGHKLSDGQGRVLRGTGSSMKVTDGPYAESREVIGGLFIIEAANYDEVLDLCKDCPHLEFGSIEIREVEPT